MFFKKEKLTAQEEKQQKELNEYYELYLKLFNNYNKNLKDLHKELEANIKIYKSNIKEKYIEINNIDSGSFISDDFSYKNSISDLMRLYDTKIKIKKQIYPLTSDIKINLDKDGNFSIRSDSWVFVDKCPPEDILNLSQFINKINININNIENTKNKKLEELSIYWAELKHNFYDTKKIKDNIKIIESYKNNKLIELKESREKLENSILQTSIENRLLKKSNAILNKNLYYKDIILPKEHDFQKEVIFNNGYTLTGMLYKINADYFIFDLLLKYKNEIFYNEEILSDNENICLNKISLSDNFFFCYKKDKNNIILTDQYLIFANNKTLYIVSYQDVDSVTFSENLTDDKGKLILAIKLKNKYQRIKLKDMNKLHSNNLINIIHNKSINNTNKKEPDKQNIEIKNQDKKEILKKTNEEYFYLLNNLSELKEKGILSQEEFNNKKEEILKRI